MTFQKRLLLAAPAALVAFLGVVEEARGSGQYVVQPGAASAARACTLEAWRSDFGQTSLANVTCRADAPVHFTVEVGVPDSGSEQYVFEGHYQLRSHASGGYDLGVFAGTSYDSGPGTLAESVLLVPATLTPVADRVGLHFNLGAVYDHQSNDTEPFWGAAVEWRLIGPLTLVGESFAVDGVRPTLHAGLRLPLLDSRLTLDVSYLDEGEPGGAQGWAAGAAVRLLSF